MRQTNEDKKRILKERAKALAREPEVQERSQDCIEIVEFVLSGERYGVESSSVREIYPLKEIVPVPCTPPFILGMANVRGQILSVIDIKKFFDLPEKGLAELDKVIIVQNGEITLGMHADAVLGVRSIMLGEIQSPLPTLTGIREEYLKGVTRDQMAILDVERILSDKKLIVHEEVEA